VTEREIVYAVVGRFVNSCYATLRDCCARADSRGHVELGKRPSDALRKGREEDAARRLSNASSDRLPDRNSLDGYTVGEVPPDQVGQLSGKIGAPPGGLTPCTLRPIVPSCGS
jgi:hypothetical protein